MGNNIFTNMNRDEAGYRSITRFNGYYSNPYRDPFINGNSFIFVTKPQLFIRPMRPSVANDTLGEAAYLNMTRDPKFNQFLVSEVFTDMDREIVNSLSYDNELFRSSFLPMFTNETKRVDAVDVSLESLSTFDTKQGYKEELPTHTTISTASGTISISVNEDANLSFTKLLTLWVNYINNIVDGTFDANPNMIKDGVLDYMCSIYYFVLEPDGKTLKYWSKLTGCWPTTIPYSSLSYDKGSADPVELSITFQYTVKEDMDPRILEDFNRLSLRVLGETIPDNPSIDYLSISENPLLVREKILETFPTANIIFESDRRDPLILYREGTLEGIAVDKESGKFEIIFDDYAYHSEMIDNIFENNNDYLNNMATNYLKEGYHYGKYNESDFWKEENI